MLLAGIDLACNGEKNPSAIAIGELADDSLVLAGVEPAVVGMSEVLARLGSREGLSGVAIDAPLIIRNQQGQRVCERDVSREYGSRGAGCHPSNRNLYPNAGSVHLAKELRGRGFDHLHGDRWQIECYPHPSIIEVFGLERRLLYKKGSVADKRAGQIRLASLIASLQNSHTLRLEIPDSCGVFFDTDRIESLKGRALKSNEDALDSILCLYIAGLYASGKPGRVFGDTRDGYIWVPTVNCVG
mgnify:FL=1